MPGRGEGTYAVTVPATTAPATLQLASARCRLAGWSLFAGDVAGQSSTGTVTAPAAGAVIATLPSVPPGEYAVEWIVALTGAAAAAEVNNFGLYVNGVLQAVSNNPGAAGNYLQDNVQVFVPPGGASVQVKAIGAGTAGVTYDASEVLTGGPGMQATLNDSGNTLGSAASAPGNSDTHMLGGNGVYVSTGVTLKVLGGTVSGCIYLTDPFCDYGG